MPREFKATNPPEWMLEDSPKMMQRASEIAAHLVEEGYSEEQAYEIALERLQDEEPLEADTIHTVNEDELTLDEDVSGI